MVQIGTFSDLRIPLITWTFFAANMPVATAQLSQLLFTMSFIIQLRAVVVCTGSVCSAC